MEDRINIPFKPIDKLPVGFSNPKPLEEVQDRILEHNQKEIDTLKNYDIHVIKEEELSKIKRNSLLYALLICLGLLGIAGAIFYGFYYDKFASEIFCGNVNLTCESQTCNCPANTCPAVSCGDCGNCDCAEMPNNINLIINYTNGSS